MTALVYGEWPDRTKNIKPFFTASYSEKERVPISKRPLSKGVNLAFVGTLTDNKSPLTSLEVLRELNDKGIEAYLTFCGEGSQRIILEQKISDYDLKDNVLLLGNISAEKVKEVLINSHFLVFISRSEGWPKAVSEAMWWGCLPITTSVSCVPWMLDYGKRGELVNGDVKTISAIVEKYVTDQDRFSSKSAKATEWSRQYSLEKFEKEIKILI
jgi:glycosyltransferase involved in cell wall biosynthesis